MPLGNALMIAAAVLALAFLHACNGETAPKTAAAEAERAATWEMPAPGVPTAATGEINAAVAARLPIADEEDFDNARRGFIAAIDGGIIRDDGARVVWDLTRYEFLSGEAPASVNPSLWRQAKLNSIHGLFEVVDGVYQLRGYDLAVMTVIRGETGWILVDPLLSRETARAALDLVNSTLGERPVTAVLFTHSHADHYGGVRGVASQEDVDAGRIRIIAPDGFMKAVTDENVLAANAMSRRAAFQFGAELEAGPAGQVDSGIGKALSAGVIGLIAPGETVREGGESKIIDGVEFEFIDAPDTEAPAEFMFYLPSFRALHTAELATGTLHNVLTLRGAKVRDPLAWSKRIDDVLTRYGARADVVLASHNWPRWGEENVRVYLERQRDAYRWVHDQTMRLANLGYTMTEIPELVGEPDFMSRDFSVRGYYGTVSHNSKAVYQRYFGWWDGNPANLYAHPPEEEAKRYVALAGGADKMIDAAGKAFADGDYRWTATLMNHLVFAEPENNTAKSLLAGAYDQLGFQSESSIWRNYFLTAAKELREGVPRTARAEPGNRDFVSAISTADYFDALAVRVNPAKTGGDHSVNFDFSDTGEKFSVTIIDGVANPRPALRDDAKVTVRLDRADLDDITLGRATFQSKLLDGSIKIDGNPALFAGFLRSHDQFERDFNIVTP